VTKIVLATRNAHKVVELREILAGLVEEIGLEIVGVSEFPDVEDVVEDGVTFAQNATLKAVAVARATGLPAIADDSGLAVDVLGGAPGGRVFLREGQVRGTLTRAPRGTNGFGYDPILLVDGDTRTLAEYDSGQKNAISHRGKALRALEADLREALR